MMSPSEEFLDAERERMSQSPKAGYTPDMASEYLEGKLADLKSSDPRKYYAERNRLLRELSPDGWLSLYRGEDEIISSVDLRKILADMPKSLVSFNTGIPSLDRLTDGVRGGELIIVSGRTKHGKTALCQTITNNLHKAKTKSVWFTYEVPIGQFLEQMDPACEFYIPQILASNTLSWLKDRMIESWYKHGCRVAFIDHLHYLVDMAQLKNPSLQIGSLVRSLKRMAVDLNFVIFLVCHVRNIERGMEPNEDDLRDSGFIKAEADTTWMVSRLIDKETKEAGSQARVRVCNHRRTGVMGRSVNLVKAGRYFEQYYSGAESVEASDDKTGTDGGGSASFVESGDGGSQGPLPGFDPGDTSS